MLSIHFANRYETLADLLLDRLEDDCGEVFSADQIIVPSAALRRSLTLAIADRQGICANVEFMFLARWLWQQVGRVIPSVPAESPFTPDALAWRIYRAFADPEFVSVHSRLAAYDQGADEVMRYELACRVAATLEQYVTYRPDWLAQWQGQGHSEVDGIDEAARSDERWQAALWQRIARDLGLGAVHPIAALIHALEQGGARLAQSAGLPRVVHVFALPAIPPLHLQALQQLGRWIEIHLYVINPCAEYWFELIDPKRLSHLAASGKAQGQEVGNQLLAAWGKQTQSHIGLLVDASGATVQDDSHFEPAAERDPGTG